MLIYLAQLQAARTSRRRTASLFQTPRSKAASSPSGPKRTAGTALLRRGSSGRPLAGVVDMAADVPRTVTCRLARLGFTVAKVRSRKIRRMWGQRRANPCCSIGPSCRHRRRHAVEQRHFFSPRGPRPPARRAWRKGWRRQLCHAEGAPGDPWPASLTSTLTCTGTRQPWVGASEEGAVARRRVSQGRDRAGQVLGALRPGP